MTAESVLTTGEFSGNHCWLDSCKKFVIVHIPRGNKPQAEPDMQAQAAASLCILLFSSETAFIPWLEHT